MAVETYGCTIRLEELAKACGATNHLDKGKKEYIQIFHDVATGEVWIKQFTGDGFSYESVYADPAIYLVTQTYDPVSEQEVMDLIKAIVDKRKAEQG